MNTKRFTINFSHDISDLIYEKTREAALNQGLDYAISVTETIANEVRSALDNQQSECIDNFSHGRISHILFEGLSSRNIDGTAVKAPEKLPELNNLMQDLDCIRLSLSNQVLLALVGHFPVAYNIENEGRLTRFVADFKNSPTNQKEEDSQTSHHGGALGAHTEGPYHSAFDCYQNHSPCPSSLILTARYNPKLEPTSLIPIMPILEKLGVEDLLALTTSNFNFDQRNYVGDDVQEFGTNRPILEVDNDGRIAIKFNESRFSVSSGANSTVLKAFNEFKRLIQDSRKEKIVLKSSNAILINNNLALHCRDKIQDKRRLLIRLYGYRYGTGYISLQALPHLVKG